MLGMSCVLGAHTWRLQMQMEDKHPIASRSGPQAQHGRAISLLKDLVVAYNLSACAGRAV
jgi:hypothetical protein